MKRRILKQIKFEDKIVILYNYMDYDKSKVARNVELYIGNEKKWEIASLSNEENDSTDCWTDIWFEGNTLKAFNFQCFNCTIDINNGSIQERMFTK